MGVVFDDTFTEASDTTLASHTPDTGTGWTKAGGTGTLEITAATDDVAADSDHENTSLIYTAQHSGTNAEYDVEVDITAEGAGNDDPVLINGRFASATSTYHVRFWNRGPIDLQLLKVVAGVPTGLAQADTDNDWTTARLKLEIRDATKKVFFGATEELSSTDNAVTAQGEGCIHLGNGAGATTDDVDSGWIFDNFTITEPDAAAIGHGRLLSNERNRLVVAF